MAATGALDPQCRTQVSEGGLAGEAEFALDAQPGGGLEAVAGEQGEDEGALQGRSRHGGPAGRVDPQIDGHQCRHE